MPLLPLFEAIKNSFDAVENLNKHDQPIIRITLERDRTQFALEEEGTYNYPISGFKIEDNGPGFNDENYASFQTSDSTYKARSGGKGVGRFIWLKAFESVFISSIYEEKDIFYERQFSFILSYEGIEGGKPIQCVVQAPITIVHLRNFKDEYKSSCPKKVDTIAHKILEHFLVFFMANECPSVFLIDDNGESINLNKLFHTEYKTSSRQVEYNVRGHSFKMAGVKIKSSNPLNHKLFYCANGREVFDESLKDSITDLNSALISEDGEPFIYQAIISGEILDKTVNTERTDFNIPKKTAALQFDEITLTDIRHSTIDEITSELEPYLHKIGESKIERITTYIRKDAPQYRPILKYGQNQISNIPPGISDDLLDIELHKIHQNIELEVKKQSKQFLDSNIKDIRQYPVYQKKYNEFIEKLNDVGKANIAKYIVHRRIVLDLLANTLNVRNEDTYDLEESVHSIIFPIRTTSDDINYDQHNLWILDEKLSYHYLLASDKQLSQIDVLNTDSKKRCDLLVFNNPYAFVDQKDEFSSVVIIEFKRPMRKDFSEENDNPITQVYNYVRELRNQKKLDKNGRPVPIKENTPVYAYIGCDLTQKIKLLAENAGLDITLDGRGYFGFNKQLHTYVEILSYDKILIDSQKRNRVLFDKLNIV